MTFTAIVILILLTIGRSRMYAHSTGKDVPGCGCMAVIIVLVILGAIIGGI